MAENAVSGVHSDIVAFKHTVVCEVFGWDRAVVSCVFLTCLADEKGEIRRIIKKRDGGVHLWLSMQEINIA